MIDTILKMGLTSPAFKEGERIPVKYTADGEDVSPRYGGPAPLEARQNLRSYAMIQTPPVTLLRTG